MQKLWRKVQRTVLRKPQKQNKEMAVVPRREGRLLNIICLTEYLLNHNTVAIERIDFSDFFGIAFGHPVIGEQAVGFLFHIG